MVCIRGLVQWKQGYIMVHSVRLLLNEWPQEGIVR